MVRCVKFSDLLIDLFSFSSAWPKAFGLSTDSHIICVCIYIYGY